MLSKQEGNGCVGKQLFNVGSSWAVMKVSHLHSPQANSSGENLSPRSVLEQRAHSGLAIALDLDNKIHPPTQENVFICRFLSKERFHHILLMNSQGPRTASHGSVMVGRDPSIQRLNHLPHDDEMAPPDSDLGLGMAASLHMCGQDECGDDAHELGGDHNSERVSLCCPSRVKLSSSSSPPMNIMINFTGTCRSFPESAPTRSSWLHQQNGRLSTSSFMEESIFSHPAYATHSVIDNGDGDLVSSPVREDFLKLCFFCKSQLSMGKDIYMYRGDQAFCSAECRYQQIVTDEGKDLSS